MLNCCALCLGNNGILMACILLPNRALDIGVDGQTAAMLISIVGGFDFIGKILGGWFADLG